MWTRAPSGACSSIIQLRCTLELWPLSFWPRSLRIHLEEQHGTEALVLVSTWTNLATAAIAGIKQRRGDNFPCLSITLSKILNKEIFKKINKSDYYIPEHEGTEKLKYSGI